MRATGTVARRPFYCADHTQCDALRSLTVVERAAVARSGVRGDGPTRQGFQRSARRRSL